MAAAATPRRPLSSEDDVFARDFLVSGSDSDDSDLERERAAALRRRALLWETPEERRQREREEEEDDELDRLLEEQLKTTTNILARQIGLVVVAPILSYYIVRVLMGYTPERYSFPKPKLKDFFRLW
jgi:hypothetical protein